MLEYRLENEGVSSKAADKSFNRFNKLLKDENSAERLRGAIGELAVGRRPRFWQLRARKYGRVVNKVLDTTRNGEQIGAPDPTWKYVFEDEAHNREIHSSERNLNPQEIEERRRKIGLRTLDVVARLNTTEGKKSLVTETKAELVAAA